jgi:hypothetical protein
MVMVHVHTEKFKGLFRPFFLVALKTIRLSGVDGEFLLNSNSRVKVFTPAGKVKGLGFTYPSLQKQRFALGHLFPFYPKYGQDMSCPCHLCKNLTFAH